VPRNDPRFPRRTDPARWPSWARGERPDRPTALTSRRGLRVEVRQQDGGWAVRPGGHPDLAWSHCSDADLERTLGLTLGLDGAEARALAEHVRAQRCANA
jgi:hypothetical protein